MDCFDGRLDWGGRAQKLSTHSGLIILTPNWECKDPEWLDDILEYGTTFKVLLFVANFLYKDRISFDSSVKIRKLSGKVTFLLEVCLNITSNPKLGYIIGFAWESWFCCLFWPSSPSPWRDGAMILPLKTSSVWRQTFSLGETFIKRDFSRSISQSLAWIRYKIPITYQCEAILRLGFILFLVTF